MNDCSGSRFNIFFVAATGLGITACSQGQKFGINTNQTQISATEDITNFTPTAEATRVITTTPEVQPTQFVSEIERQIDKWGVAEKIPAFEFHGDKYDMYDGRYAMTPESFVDQMVWFKNNDFHAVTGPELTLFSDGIIDLPKRSVILTTDSGKGSINSMPRVIPVLKETGMHFHSFIWTADMIPECPTWEVFEEGIRQGVLTIGSHSERHGDFAQYTAYGMVSELNNSKNKIEDRLGITINSISWPLESCPVFASDLVKIGYRYAFGGYSRDKVIDLAVKKADKNPFCLPRIFPPNEEGISMRPKGLTLKEIMELYIGEEIS